MNLKLNNKMAYEKVKIDRRKNRQTTTVKLSITLSEENVKKLDQCGLKNKSAFINWLLANYYGLNEDGGVI